MAARGMSNSGIKAVRRSAGSVRRACLARAQAEAIARSSASSTNIARARAQQASSTSLSRCATRPMSSSDTFSGSILAVPPPVNHQWRWPFRTTAIGPISSAAISGACPGRTPIWPTVVVISISSTGSRRNSPAGVTMRSSMVGGFMMYDGGKIRPSRSGRCGSRLC